jgi:hypothetical protein
MKRRILPILLVGLAPVLALTVLLVMLRVNAQGPVSHSLPNAQAGLGTAFTYQGRLERGGRPANGTLDLQFELYDALTDGAQVGETVTRSVVVTQGLFVVDLDFGAVFDGAPRYLQIGVRAQGAGVYTSLAPRQWIAPAPYALYSAGSLTATQAISSAHSPWQGLSGVPAGFADGVDDDALASLSCSKGQIAKWEGSAWACGEDEPTVVPAGSDCAAIQAAVDALPAAGGRVLLAAGTYTCSAPIVIARDGVDLRGQGAATLLRLADGANAPVLVLGETATPPPLTHTHLHVSDLTIDGNRENQSLECWGGPCDTGGTSHVRNNGITVRRITDATIERVAIYRARSGGLVTEKTCRRLTVRDLTSADNYFDGLAAYETEDSVLSGLYLYDNRAAGLSLDIRFNHNLLSDVVIANSGSVGIFMRDSRDNVFHGLQIRDSAQHGAFLAQVDTDPGTPAYGNTFESAAISNSGGAGLRVNDASCLYNLVSASQFVANAGGCISETVPGMVVSGTVICR